MTRTRLGCLLGRNLEVGGSFSVELSPDISEGNSAGLGGIMFDVVPEHGTVCLILCALAIAGLLGLACLPVAARSGVRSPTSRPPA